MELSTAERNGIMAQSLATPRIGDILVRQGVLTPDQIRQALDEQILTRQRLGTILTNRGWADEEQVTRARAIQMDVTYVSVAEEIPDPMGLAQITFETAQRYLLLPLSYEDNGGLIGRRIRVAMANPWDIEAIDLVQRETHRRVEPLLASAPALIMAIERAYHEAVGDARNAEMDGSLEEASLSAEVLQDTNEEVDLALMIGQGEQGPIIRFVNSLIVDAIRQRASDIHIEPMKKEFQVRYRIDGHLQTIRRFPMQYLPAASSRIKIMSEMDISERRLPLDGRITMRLDGRSVDLRVSTLPTQYGERIVMRILDRSATLLTLDQLGFSSHNSAAFQGLIRHPHGIILVTGPTGSGKTTTLYAALNALKSPTTNIITCEDPIEYELEGISQSNVNERAGLTFARQLRAILRQDPDIVLVGEIRDAETAEIAFRAALTGHLVLSTLHCNSAAGAVSRLRDMGVPPFLIASTLIGVVAQRLVRRLCPHCRRKYAPDPTVQALYSALGGMPVPGLHLYEAVGCPRCSQSGTRGRVAVHEVLVANNRFQRLVMEEAESHALRDVAMEAGMISMLEDGLEKARQGLTPLVDIEQKIGLTADD